jgi:hypothetical protein
MINAFNSKILNSNWIHIIKIDEDDYLVGQFDLNEFQFVIKEDLFGLGYKRLDVKNLFSHNDSSKSAIDESPAASLLFPMIDKKPKATAGGMRGQVRNIRNCKKIKIRVRIDE